MGQCDMVVRYGHEPHWPKMVGEVFYASSEEKRLRREYGVED
jgi:hypothetical protein